MITEEKLTKYMQVAESVSVFSHDDQTKVASLLVNKNTGAILATGFNGFIRGADDSILPKTRPEKYDYMIHAEQNMICNAARHSVNVSNCFVVLTLTPCVTCLRVLWQAGIDTVFCRDMYRDFDKSRAMKDLKINCENVGKYIKITLQNNK